MRLEDIPYNLSYAFDADLREVPVDPESMAKAIDWLLERLQSSPDEPDVLSWLGVCCRMLRRESEAEGYLLKALQILEDASPGAFVARLRLAHVYQWQGRFDEAGALFRRLLHEVETRSDLRQYEDFVYQHFGKFFFDLGEYGDAEGWFRRALDLRRERGASPDLLKSAETALEEAENQEAGR